MVDRFAVFRLDSSVKVRCAALGSRSCQVLASGNSDDSICIWLVSDDPHDGHAQRALQPLLTIRSQTTSIGCVTFCPTEEQLASGSENGNLKVSCNFLCLFHLTHFLTMLTNNWINVLQLQIWNLDEGRLRRTLTGHKAAISAVDFSQSDPSILVSGSLDQTVKLWDIRRKGCIQTYRQHGEAVNDVKLSPHGKWVVSASGDGKIVMTNLESGKLLATLQDEGKAPKAISFHPHEYILAAHCNGEVSFFDLDKYERFASRSVDCGAAGKSCMRFHPNGGTLLVAGTRALSSLQWEDSGTPSRQPSITVDWCATPSDMKFMSGGNDEAIPSLVSLSFLNNLIELHRVDVDDEFEQSQLCEASPTREPDEMFVVKLAESSDHSTRPFTAAGPVRSLAQNSVIKSTAGRAREIDSDNAKSEESQSRIPRPAIATGVKSSGEFRTPGRHTAARGIRRGSSMNNLAPVEKSGDHDPAYPTDRLECQDPSQIFAPTR